MYPRASSGLRLIASVYSLTEPAKSPDCAVSAAYEQQRTLNSVLPSSRALSESAGLMYAKRSASAFDRSISLTLSRTAGSRCSDKLLLSAA